jgi:RNA polymerase sigma-70 factor (sigma-E family)
VNFEEYARAELQPLLGFARVLCGDRGLAEDVLQEVLIRAERNWTKISAANSPTAYLRRMIVNEFLSWRRKWARIIPQSELFIADGSPDHADQQADRAELAAELARLPRRQRAVLVLRYYIGAPDAEIAQILDCTEGTVRSHASRGLAALRVELTRPILAQKG